MSPRDVYKRQNYDSADYVGGIGEIDVAFKGILYDFFSEEKSSKVLLTLDTKRGRLLKRMDEDMEPYQVSYHKVKWMY